MATKEVYRLVYTVELEFSDPDHTHALVIRNQDGECIASIENSNLDYSSIGYIIASDAFDSLA